MPVTPGVLRGILAYIRDPEGFARGTLARADVIGAVAVVDILAFLIALRAFASGLEGDGLSWRLVGHFLYLYLTAFGFVTLAILIETHIAWAAGRALGKEVPRIAAAVVFAYTRVPLLVGGFLYLWLPYRMDAATVLARLGMGDALGPSAFLFRIEVFEAMALALQIGALRTLGAATRLTAPPLAVAAWLLTTAIAYGPLVK
jgi:hypothetical protein